jgi:ubiquinone/menaquinone biosynthesis C-methylase UbiE
MPGAPAHEPAQEARMLQLLASHYLVQAIGTMARLGLADHLAQGPRPSDEVARAAKADPPSVYRLLRTLTAIGVVKEEPGQRFALTPLGETLRSGPGSMGPIAAMHAHPVFWRACGALVESVRTGGSGFHAAHGQGLFDTLRGEPEAARWFDEAMTTFSVNDARGVPQAYDFRPFQRVVDVGGGQGHLLMAVLRANPHLRGTLVDQAHNVATARKRFEAEGLAARAELVAGDFFRELPPGADAYLLANVLQDWSDDDAARILGTIRRAMGPGSRLLVVEITIEDGPRGAVGRIVDISNLVAGGRTRTREEHAALLAKAGLRLQRIVPTGVAVNILEAVPA